ncbi:TetR family transcriptional regulator [Mangrovactinospora gilvigrisea]|uniref:TetR family transcriptional regulator n=1 Tax=Mangrovactinospora gilvigrisea TaxID=1428644 RepID=A0A1J7BXS4_9ACTN|nr:TetR/AcrR family transcriptional regulator [Mangrovactinospora gilvigrisea]OIV38297.1 TetR family transcriptional regulator [Mangrovactinospora gilvigrisea]
MSVQERKERERARRERLIVETARELAEKDGWDAVTTRRLAERIEYSQPVLYSHFRGKREIIGAVAMDGCTELAQVARAAAAGAEGLRAKVTAVARAYLDFGRRNPALYDAIFQLDGGLLFASDETPEPLKDAFAAMLEVFGEVAGDGVHPALFTEVFWTFLHGQVTLARAGRTPEEFTDQRLELFIGRMAVFPPD